MQRVLVVDDERDFRDQICLCLQSEGCEVQGAANCREAVRIAERDRPDVLVADWMLRDHLHGLHVSEVLGAVNPSMRTVLMTGYASADLRAEAEGHHVSAFLEKPFEPARLAQAVKDAPASQAAHHPPIGVFRVRADRSLVWANDVAKDLLGADEGLPCPTSELAKAPTDWTAVEVGGKTRHLLGKDYEDGGMLVVALDDERLPVLRDHPVVQSLLGTPDRERVVWTLPGHVLLVDDEDYVRRFVAGEFQRSGCPCLTAENGDVALRLFARDEQIRYVLLDWYMPGDDARELVRRFHEIRPSVQIVGLSGEDRREDFRRIGIERFLAKPVRIETLVEELQGAAAPGTRNDSEWSTRLEDLCAEFDSFMQRRPGARATRAMSVVRVLCDAWPRALSVQEIVDTVWTEPNDRMRRAAGSVRNALNTVARNFREFNREVAEPLHGLHCSMWRSEVKDSKLCRYALRVEPVEDSVQAPSGVRSYIASLPRPVLESMYAVATGAKSRLSPEAEQACRDIGSDLSDAGFRDAVVQAVERSRR
ncbi:MAG: response regulator [Planctomycetota bacterium]|jgi:CheY-like chemotaxis protein